MKQIVIISGKGGTGKTSIAAALAGAGPRKIIADCDVDAADMHLVLSPEILSDEDFYSGQTADIDFDQCIQCGLCVTECRFDAVSQSYSIIKEKCEGCGLCEYLCPSGAITMQDRMCGHQYVSKTRFGTLVHAALGIGEENSGKLVTSVRKKARDIAEAEKAEFVLVDGSPGIGCPVIASMTDIDACILVAEPTVSAVHDLKRVHELAKHFQVPCMSILNKCGINRELEFELELYCLNNDILLLGSFQYDLDFCKAQLKGQTIAEFKPTKYGPVINDIWNGIICSLDTKE